MARFSWCTEGKSIEGTLDESARLPLLAAVPFLGPLAGSTTARGCAKGRTFVALA
jgi:hypothetical protein